MSKAPQQFVAHLCAPSSSSSNKSLSPITDYQTVIKKFITTINYPLKCIPDNLKRAESFHKEFGGRIQTIVHDLLNNVDDNSKAPVLRKNDALSTQFRDAGNKHFQSKQLQTALRCYTLACCFATPGSKSLALAYSNRSACFAEMKLTAMCLRDIDRFETIASNWTDHDDIVIFNRVMDRKTRCNDKLQLDVSVDRSYHKGFERLFQLKKPSGTVPCAEEFIGLVSDSSRGRHVRNVGDRVIQPGELIILERPFSKVLLNAYEFELKHCNGCFKDLEGAGVPCPSCVFHVYCPDCYSTGHMNNKLECTLAPYLYELNMDRTLHLAFQTLLQVQSQQLYSTPTVHQEQYNDPSSILPGMNSEGVYDSTSYLPINKLMWHEDIITEPELKEYLTYSTVICELLGARTNYFDNNEQSNHHQNKPIMFISLMLLHLMNFPCNAHSIYQLESSTQVSTQSPMVEIGAGAFPFLSMINHSCDPNVVRVTLKDGVTAVLTITHIPPGHEVLDNYGAHYAIEDRVTRRAHLRKFYNFVCDCPACVMDWPLFSQLGEDNAGSSPDLTKKYTKSCDEIMDQLGNVGVIDLWDVFNRSVELLCWFDSNFKRPYKYINIMQEVVKQCVFIAASSMMSSRRD